MVYLVYSCEKFSLKKYLFLHRFSLISFYFRLFLRATEKRVFLRINILLYLWKWFRHRTINLFERKFFSKIFFWFTKKKKKKKKNKQSAITRYTWKESLKWIKLFNFFSPWNFIFVNNKYTISSVTF